LKIPRAWYSESAIIVEDLTLLIHFKKIEIMATENKPTNLSAGCGNLTHGVNDNGRPLDPGKATGYVKNYLEGLTDPKGQDHNYGYLFGLTKVTDLMTLITGYNSKKPAIPIEGVRVYIGRQNPIKAGDPMPPREKIMDTLFLMPVLANGNDLYKVHQLADVNMILGDPRPCPTLCLMLSFSQE
jgi:hypothetical protein